MAFEVKYEESTTEISKDVVLANERDIIVVVFTTLGQNVHVGEVTQWLHHNTVASEMAKTVMAVGRVADFAMQVVILHQLVMTLCCHFILLLQSVLLHVPDKAAFLCVARSADMQMVFKHDML